MKDSEKRNTSIGIHKRVVKKWDNEHTTLKFWYTNAQSLNNKLDEFHTIITEENSDVVGVTKTWGNANNFDSEYNVNDRKLL